MESTVTRSAGPRSHPRLWAFSLIFGTAAFYFVIRERITPKVVTTDQEAFLLGYSLLVACAYMIGLTRMMLGMQPPRWLDAWWKQIAACVIVSLVLTGLNAVLPMPPFYRDVLQHSTVLLVLPFVLNGRSRIATARWLDDPPAPPARTTSLAHDTEHDIVLHISRRKALVLFVVASLFVIAGWWMRSEAPVVAWTCIALFGLGIPLGLLMLFPGFSYLRLQRDGFTMRHSWRQFAFRWDEISDLTVVSGVHGSRVAFNIHKPGARRSSMLREMYGRDMLLTDNYGLSASQLCALMQSRQTTAAHPSA